MEELRRTPLHAEHARLGARLVPFAGFEMPVQYSGISAEHTAVRERAGLFDVSHMGELWLEGPTAAEVVDGLVTNHIARLEDGKAAYTCCCNEGGTILDDLIVYRFAKDRVLIVCNASNHDKIAGHFAEQTRGKTGFTDATDGTALLALQGPKALAVLEKTGVGIDVTKSLPSFRITETTVAGRKAIVARTGYTGEDGVEIFCKNEDAVHVWTALLAAGESFGILPVGLGARDTLRLEARLALYGNDIDETTNPLEAGLGWVVKLDKPFIGRDAIARVKAAGPSRALVGFEMVGRGVARHGYPLKGAAGETIGVCTSGGPSPTLGKSIGLGYVPVATAKVGNEIVVDCRGRDTAAKLVPTPFYKRAR
ncbi:MAG TPA: glycine cleavage system aminomethyltransferase GcvT [Polyangiaceae bacterium]|jgi:aminomethyltransferase|nr:glycine cleavage system aminomethyltransferase GcvT [Polyangiaceae bacterium]